MVKRSIFVLFMLLFSVCAFAQNRTVVDMRGEKVVIPAEPKRVATIDDGLVEGVMTHLGVIDRVAVIGSWSMKRDYKYDFETADGQKYTLRGWNTMKVLHPWLDDLPCINSPQGNILNYEALAEADPELVILRVGDCTVGGGDKNAVKRTIAMIESLEIPVIVLYAPLGNDLSSMKTEISIIGEIFAQKEKAEKLADYLHATQLMIEKRSKKAENKTSMLYLGLNPDVRKKGGAGQVYGADTPESYIIENIANAKNAFNGKGRNIPLSTEQIYALDPDVIVLPTSNGYHPPKELYDSRYFENLSDLTAVKNRTVYAMPWSPMNCARRVEYPLDMLIIAKAAYPALFNDIKVHEFALNFYKEVYGVDDATAKKLRSEQLLDWAVEMDF